MALHNCDLCSTSNYHDRTAPTRVRIVSGFEDILKLLSQVSADINLDILLRDYRKDNIIWECNNGGQLWTSAASQTTATQDTGSIPSGFCGLGFSSLNIAFIVSLLVDLVFQVSDGDQVFFAYAADMGNGTSSFTCTS